MRIVVWLLLVMGMVTGCANCVLAGTCIYGLSGFIETPSDTTTDPSAVTFTGRYVADFGDSKFNLLGYGGTIGIVPKLEVGAVGLDSDAPRTSVKGIFNIKFRMMDESFDRPSVTIGAVDLANNIGSVSRGIDRTSMFLIIGRNLASVTESWGGLVSTPLRGTLGIGTGIYKGVFLGVSWSPSSKIEIMGEYLSNGIRQSHSANAGVRVNPFGGLSVEVGTLGFKDLYGGISYSLSMY